MGEFAPDLVREVDARPRVTFEGVAFRHLGPGHSPSSGEGARIRGGRWNPAESFPTLYLALSIDTVVAEFYRLAERQGMPPENLLPRRIQTYGVELQAVLDLRDPTARQGLGLSDAVIAGDDPTLCQSVGDAAHYAGFEAILAPSATGIGLVLAVFVDRMVAGSSIRPDSFEFSEGLPPRPGTDSE